MIIEQLAHERAGETRAFRGGLDPLVGIIISDIVYFREDVPC